MSSTKLPDSIDILVNKLRVAQFKWRGVPFQIPHFAVNAVISNPIIDKYVKRDEKYIGLIYEGRYTIPVIDPFKGDIDVAPEHIVVVHIYNDHHFGLFGYPANSILGDIYIPANHKVVSQITRAFTD